MLVYSHYFYVQNKLYVFNFCSSLDIFKRDSKDYIKAIKVHAETNSFTDSISMFAHTNESVTGNNFRGHTMALLRRSLG